MREELELTASLCAGILTAILQICLLCYLKKNRDRDKTAGRLFEGMCVNTLVISLMAIAEYALALTGHPFGYLAAVVAVAVKNFLLIFLPFQWMLYVDYKLYRSRDQLRRRYRVFLAILLILQAVTVCIDVVGASVGTTDYVLLVQALIATGLSAVFLILLIIPFVVLWQYCKKHPKEERFRISPVVIPFAAGFVFSSITDIDAFLLGISVGFVVLVVSMRRTRQYTDLASGFFNEQFLDLLAEGEDSRGEKYNGVVVFETETKGEELSEILRSVLPDEGMIIRTRENRFLLFSERGKRADLSFMAEVVSEAAEGKMPLKTECTIRKKDEGTAEFLNRVRQTGGE